MPWAEMAETAGSAAGGGREPSGLPTPGVGKSGQSETLTAGRAGPKLMDMDHAPTVWTIGYERASLDDVVGALRAAGIRTLLDVRELPLSRRAGFSKSPLRAALQEAGIDYDSAEAEFVPNLKVEVDLETARKVLRLVDALDELDDVQSIYANYDIPAEVQAQLDEEE